MSSGAMQSNVGNPQVYNDGDQRAYSREEKEAITEHAPTRYGAGQANSHRSLDSKDERTIGNRLDAEANKRGQDVPQEVEAFKKDPRAQDVPAQREEQLRKKGKDSRHLPGHLIPWSTLIEAEDEEQLRKKGKI
ncbi:hypothetical protein ACEPAG_1630 [Sanghuangporus baumii]